MKYPSRGPGQVVRGRMVAFHIVAKASGDWRKFVTHPAASAVEAKEGVAQGGAHLKMRDDTGPGPLTHASAAQAVGGLWTFAGRH